MPQVLSHGRESTLAEQYIQQFLFIRVIDRGYSITDKITLYCLATTTTRKRLPRQASIRLTQ